jgi:hypothetical protein
VAAVAAKPTIPALSRVFSGIWSFYPWPGIVSGAGVGASQSVGHWAEPRSRFRRSLGHLGRSGLETRILPARSSS